MKKMPPLILIEPAARQKQYRLAEVIVKGSTKYSQEEVKLHLKQIRSYSADNVVELMERFRRSIAKYSDASIILANDAPEAVDYITQVIPNTKTIAIGKSSTINELRPGLEKSGYTLIDTYSPQFSQGGEGQKRVNYPWQLPAMLSWSAWDTFDYSSDTRQQAMPGQGVKDIAALLGVNAASAEDGSIFFLQHSANIGAILRQARKLILVIGLEKIVGSSSDAFFQTKCAGAFGMESVLLDLEIGDTNQELIDSLAAIPETTDSGQELHIVLLDNGRTGIAEGSYKEILQCIGCQACSKQCPGYRYLNEFGYYPQKYLWSFLTGSNPSIELCAHCAMCEVECPVDINLNQLIARAKAEYSPEIARLRDSRVLMNMPKLAPLGSLGAPLANWLSGRKLLRILIEKLAGIDSRRKSPTFHYITFERWFKSRHV